MAERSYPAPDRLQAAKWAIANGAKLLLLDDGFSIASSRVTSISWSSMPDGQQLEDYSQQDGVVKSGPPFNAQTMFDPQLQPNITPARFGQTHDYKSRQTDRLAVSRQTPSAYACARRCEYCLRDCTTFCIFIDALNAQSQSKILAYQRRSPAFCAICLSHLSLLKRMPPD